MIEETRYKETPTDVERSRITMGRPDYVESEYRSRPAPSGMIAWGPVWAGVVAAVGIQTILVVLGIAVGLSVVQGGANANSEGFGVAAGIWWVVSALISLFIGGWAAGYFASPRKAVHGAFNGFVLWCVVTALSAALVTLSSGALLGGGLGAMSDQINSSQAITRTTPNVLPPNFEGNFTGNNSSPNGVNQPSSTSGIQNASVGVAWWTFVVLVLSAGAATLGGSVGTRNDHSRRRMA